MTAARIVDCLLETGWHASLRRQKIVNPRDFILGRNAFDQEWSLKLPPEFNPITARHGRHQWETRYKKWKIVVSAYEDGTSLWSPHYPVPAFSWNKGKEQHYGGMDIVRLPANFDLKSYWTILKRYINRNPDPWKAGYVPEAPDPEDWDYGER